MASAKETIRIYNDAWLETDEEKCRALLEQTWADDGVLLDPNGKVEGREALYEYIRTFHDNMPGFTSEITKPVEEKEGRARFTWEVHTPGRGLMAEATDFVEFAHDGRIQRITIFLDRMGEGAPT